ncbi:unnamed protein product [Boreogadus saida]
MLACMANNGPNCVPLRNPPLHGAPHPGLEASHAQADLLPLPEAIPDDVNVRHISILLDGDTPKMYYITNRKHAANQEMVVSRSPAELPHATLGN